jgi:acyl-CoA synthetase (AMP-forming)/AMP-acid ligase II/acyl carrier protein
MGEELARQNNADDTVYALLEQSAAIYPDHPAILGDGVRLTYKQLSGHIKSLQSQLTSLGIGRKDRVSLVMPNGPLYATTLLALISNSTLVPLNPSYRLSEFEFYLSDIKADAVVILKGMQNPVRDAAHSLGIRIIEITDDEGFPKFAGAATSATSIANSPLPDDIALILHTSGTTSRPKIVALTHANICWSARNTQACLKLSPTDRCLNVMPLFHSHGIMTPLLATLAGGASVWCTEGFVATKFFAWLRESRITWYSAVPSIHQSIMARATGEKLDDVRLRFVRSASSPLPPKLAEAVEKMFGVPMIEGYGSTETSGPICSNPLPPGYRRLGSVGLPAGAELMIIDQTGQPLARGESGEIALRGAGVITAYENNPQANQTSFIDGWLRTGDIGHFDNDGYLFVTGRIKEMINRGGEKISPREIDEVLLAHPAVAAAVTFAMPDTRLGEEVAVAIELRGGMSITELDLIQFASDRLVDFKVPRRIVILDKIPTSPVGKPQRITLAKTLGLDSPQSITPSLISDNTAPQTKIEQSVAEIWKQVLNYPNITRGDNFLQLGGDSVLASQAMARIRDQLAVEVPVWVFFQSPTLASMAEFIQKASNSAVTTVQASSEHSSKPIDSEAGDIRDLLAEIETMSDSQVREHLGELKVSHLTES